VVVVVVGVVVVGVVVRQRQNGRRLRLGTKTTSHNKVRCAERIESHRVRNQSVCL